MLSALPPIGDRPAREVLDREIPGPSRPGTVRLASDAGRLAAVLRAHAADPTGMPREEAEVSLVPAQDGEENLDPSDEPDGMNPDGRISVEEVVERLADELETEFVRTYGSSGV